MSPEKLSEILASHRRWLQSAGRKGARADLHGANLRVADLHGADLSRADLVRADLHGADLFRTNLTGARFVGA